MKSKINRKYIVAIIIVVIVIVAIIVIQPGKTMKKGSLNNDLSSIEVSGSEFLTYINTNIVVKDGKANVLIENTENNSNKCCVKIYDYSDNGLLYESDTIPPGYYIEEVKLFKDLDKGDHAGYAVFEVLNDSGDIKSTLSIDLSIKVE